MSLLKYFFLLLNIFRTDITVSAIIYESLFAFKLFVPVSYLTRGGCDNKFSSSYFATVSSSFAGEIYIRWRRDLWIACPPDTIGFLSI